MAIFYLVFFKVLSSLLSVCVGYGAGKISKVQKESIASLLFHFIAPIVFFAIPTSASLSISDLSVTLVTFILCSMLGFFAYYAYGKIWHDSHRNILALSAGSGNSGFVVLPIATALFDDQTLTIYALGIIGIDIYSASVGYFLCARNFATVKESMMRVAKLPILNAFFFGCALSIIGFKLPDFLDEFILNMKGAYSILGMVMIGVAMSEVKEFSLDWKFTGAAFFSKFVLYPLIFNLFIFADTYVFHIFNVSYYNAMQLLTLAPLATSTIILASLYGFYPEKMATAVLLSLIFVLIYLPLMASFLLSDL